MALQLNLLHEEFKEERQRKRDPLKLGLIGLGCFGVILFLYYAWNAYGTMKIRGQLNLAQAEWAKVEPQVTAAQKRATELHQIIDSTKVLDARIENRFYWAPFLSIISQSVAPNIQLTSLDGTITDNGTISVSLEGLAAAREPRAAAEELRQLLSEQLEKHYSDVKVTFKNLEDLDTLVDLAGVPTASARFVMNMIFNPKPPDSSKKSEPAKENQAKENMEKPAAK
ncbi:MAG TPA: hypothetical protein VGI60_15770 [Chthoniobacterales bacterium]|jgi:hypothetical protein